MLRAGRFVRFADAGSIAGDMCQEWVIRRNAQRGGVFLRMFAKAIPYPALRGVLGGKKYELRMTSVAFCPRLPF